MSPGGYCLRAALTEFSSPRINPLMRALSAEMYRRSDEMKRYYVNRASSSRLGRQLMPTALEKEVGPAHLSPQERLRAGLPPNPRVPVRPLGVHPASPSFRNVSLLLGVRPRDIAVVTAWRLFGFHFG
jgi:hypothetical protein